MEEINVNIDGKEHTVRIEEESNSLKVHLHGKVYTVETSLKNTQQYDLEGGEDAGGEGTIKASLPGVIFTIDVKEGVEVKKGQKVISLVAMKMENQVKSPIDGKVKKILVKKDQKVDRGEVLLVIE